MHASRGGRFGLIEMATVVVVLLLLAGFLLPRLRRARTPSLRTTCANNMRQNGLGLLNYEQARHVFPGYANQVGDKRASWVVTILPMLERDDLYQNWSNPLISQKLPANRHGWQQDSHIARLDVLICPSVDTDRNQVFAPLSYVVNSGSARSANDFAPALAGRLPWIEDANSGVCFNRARADFDATIPQPSRFPPASAFSPSAAVGVGLKFISEHDGASRTLLLSENLQATSWVTDPHDQRLPQESEFQMRQNTAMVWFITGQQDNTYPPSAGVRGQQRYDPHTIRINARPGLKTPLPVHYAPGGQPHHAGGLAAARPSSHHSGGVNAFFCDGHIEYLSGDIDYHVYTQLMSPNGREVVVDLDPHGEPIRATAPAGSSPHVPTPWRYRLREEDL